MEEKIDIDGKDGKDEAMQSKIEAFCSTLMKIPGFPIWTMVSEESKLKLVESEIIKGLFSKLEGKNKFTNDPVKCEKFGGYAMALKLKQRLGQFAFVFDETLNNTPYVDAKDVELQEMTNREFLKKFIKQMIDSNKPFRAMPKWESVCRCFLSLVTGIAGISNLVIGISSGSKSVCFIGILILCAWAGLICSLVFHLSLAVLIPSAIVLGFVAIFCLVSIIRTQVNIYRTRQEMGADIDNFFNLVDEINNYLDTFDLPLKKISSGERIFDESSMDKKIENADMNKENNVTTEENDNEKSEEGKNK